MSKLPRNSMQYLLQVSTPNASLCKFSLKKNIHSLVNYALNKLEKDQVVKVLCLAKLNHSHVELDLS